LCHPLVGNAARTQPRGVRGAEVVEPEVGDTGFAERGSPSLLELGLVPGQVAVAREEPRARAGKFDLGLERFDRDVR
jgi:hypothetical protein